MRTTTRLRELIARPDALVIPGAYDALSARLIVQAGFPAVYMTGFGTSASVLGQPDVGLLTMSEMVSRAAALASVAGDVPLIADADTGYGNPINVRRTIREYERAGTDRLVVFGGGYPIIANGEMIGGIGVSGGHYSHAWKSRRQDWRRFRLYPRHSVSMHTLSM